MLFCCLDVALTGPADKLQTTVYSQPAVMVSALAALEELKQTRPDVMQGIGHMAGFSLGEITALVAAEAISFEDGLRVVKARAEVCARSGTDEGPQWPLTLVLRRSVCLACGPGYGIMRARAKHRPIASNNSVATGRGRLVS